MHVEPVLPEILGDHHPGLDDPRLLWQIALGEGLSGQHSASSSGSGPGRPTVAVDSASSSWMFLPTSLLVHSSVLSPVDLGVTRGIMTGWNGVNGVKLLLMGQELKRDSDMGAGVRVPKLYRWFD